MPRSDAVAPDWQCVMVLWGDKYGAETVNRLVRAVARHSANQPRFVLLTDRDRPGLDEKVTTRTIAPEWLAPEMITGGCHAKLCMFERGLVPEDLPAIYLDLDTVVMGDIGKGVRYLKRPESIMLLQSAILPFGPLARLFYRLSGKRRYARGNSSVVIYHPGHCSYIADRFKEMKRLHPDFGFKPMRADERFISWVAQPAIAAVPSSLAVKLPAEYMSRLTALSYLWPFLPGVRRRRDGLAAVTLCGDTVKPDALLALPDGGRLTDRRGRTLIWSEAVLGRVKRAIIDFYA